MSENGIKADGNYIKCNAKPWHCNVDVSMYKLTLDDGLALPVTLMAVLSLWAQCS